MPATHPALSVFFPMLLALLIAFPLGGQQVSPLARAHSHNDYRHPRPLLDALDQGFCSVEADIYLEDGELRVGHSLRELQPGRTLEALYLRPLAERVQANNGSVYPEEERFVLLIDIKRDGEAVYPVLDRLLSRYAPLFSAHLDGRPKAGPIHALLSGDRPRALLEADPTRYCALDGRPPDLGSDTPSALMPLISDNWNNHFRWRGRGEMPAPELAKLKEFVTRAHQENRLVRFWAAPDHPACWRVLLESGVNLINTDQLAGLAAFLRDETKK